MFHCVLVFIAINEIHCVHLFPPPVQNKILLESYAQQLARQTRSAQSIVQYF